MILSLAITLGLKHTSFVCFFFFSDKFVELPSLGIANNVNIENNRLCLSTAMGDLLFSIERGLC